MKPPECFACHLRLIETDPDLPVDENFTTVQFRITEEEKLSQQERDAKGVDGHPIGLEWFCIEHLPLGQSHSDMTSAEALAAIRNVLGSQQQ